MKLIPVTFESEHHGLYIQTKITPKSSYRPARSFRGFSDFKGGKSGELGSKLSPRKSEISSLPIIPLRHSVCFSIEDVNSDMESFSTPGTIIKPSSQRKTKKKCVIV
jgi:hypothetical protein